MDNLIPIYRLRKGKLYHKENLTIPFEFGLIYEDNGKYFFELFFDETLALETIFEENIELFESNFFEIEALTEDKTKINATQIIYKSWPFHKSKGDFYCFGHLRIEEAQDKPNPNDFEDGIIPSDEDRPIYYLKLEGLKMKFSEHTNIQETRGGRVVNRFSMKGAWNHSSCQIHADFEDYYTDWRLDSDGEIVIEFLNDDFPRMKYTRYLELKDDFIGLLSFLNGAPVNIKAEYTGDYYTPSKISSHIRILYSQPNESFDSYNKFIPINDSRYKSTNIISKVFLSNFDKYIELNRKLGLNDLIFYLNSVEQARSMHERVFVQTVLLEMFSSKYAENFPSESEILVDETVFNEFKADVEELMKKYKRKFGDKFNQIKSRIPNLNQAKRQQTEVKFRALIEGVGIEITSEIEQLIQVERHRIIHSGNIGEDDFVYEAMDELIRTIIIKLIGYDGPTINTLS